MFRKIISRNAKTCEVIVSKIFPAGCGWQFGSILASYNSCHPSDLDFMMTCGMCEGLAVGMGHLVYMIGKDTVTEEVDLNQEMYRSIQYGSGSTLSGIVWQPAVDYFRDDGFLPTVMATGVCCGAFFFGGLVLSKYITKKHSKEIVTIETIKNNALLSLSIGGAAGMFVATDPLINDNFLRTVYGIGDSLSFDSIYMAGFATASGFMLIQSIQNLGKNWVD